MLLEFLLQVCEEHSLPHDLVYFACWRETLLISRCFVHSRVLQCLMYTAQVLQFIRSTPTNVGLTLERTGRVVRALPARWFRGPERRLAEPLIEHVRATARTIEKQQERTGAASTAAHAAQLKKLMTHVGL